MNTFEKPLTPSEEQEYLKRYKNGDEEAGNVLILRNLRLVAHIVKHYNFDEKDIEEYLSIGTIGLIKAIKTFDCSKGNRLATYASKCIDNELLMALRSEKKKNKDISLQETVGIDFLDGYILKYNIKKLYEGIEKVLTEREKNIIIKRYGLLRNDEITQRELADGMGISRSYVSRIEKEALNKLKNYINR